MDAISFIKELRAAGFSLEVIGESLTVSPASRLRDEHRAFFRQHKPELLLALTKGQSEPGSRPASPEPKPGFTSQTPVDLGVLAASFATEFQVSLAAVLRLLDDDDRRGIACGDQAMIEAWKTAVRSIATKPQPFHVPTGTDYRMAVVVHTPAGHPVLVWAESSEHAKRLQAWSPAPQNTSQESLATMPVRCCDCAHAHPVAPGMIDCAREIPAPGACGPYRWWATDVHTCAVFLANAPSHFI